MDGCNARAEDLRDAFDDLASLGAEREELTKYANEAVRLMRVESELESRIEALEKERDFAIAEVRLQTKHSLTSWVLGAVLELGWMPPAASSSPHWTFIPLWERRRHD